MIFKPKISLMTAVALAAGVALALPALAQSSPPPAKTKKQTTPAPATRPTDVVRGQDKFRAGPLYYGRDYLGDDPDPFIRLQIQRDLSHRYGGDD